MQLKQLKIGQATKESIGVAGLVVRHRACASTFAYVFLKVFVKVFAKAFLKHVLFCTLCLLSIISNPAFAQSMTAEVNRSQLSIDESLVLTIVSDGLTGQPELSPLSKDFEVLGTSTRREVKIIQGVMSDLQSWDIEMIPKRTGELEIPSLTLKGFSSNALTVNVTDAPSAQAQAQGPVFLEVNIDNPSPMLQAQVIYTVRFYSAVRIVDGELSEPVSDKLTIRRLGDDTGFFQERNGTRYRVVERRYAIFPRESGQIEIPPVTLRVNVPDDNDSTGSFFGRVKRLTRRGPAISLDVRGKPESDPGSWWLAAKSLQLSAEWEGNIQEFRVGEPLTRTLTLEVDGATGEQLPELKPLQVPGLRVYADKPEIVEQPSSDTLLAKRVDKWAIIPQAAGELTLPAVELSWFDTVAETYRVASVPAQVINVLPQIQQPGNTAAGSVNTDAPAGTSALQNDPSASSGDTQSGLQDNLLNSTAGAGQAEGILSTQQSYWKTLALAAIVAWILSSLVALRLWLRSRSDQRLQHSSRAGASVRDHESEKAALKAVDKTLKSSDSAADVASAVLAWAACRWRHTPPQSLQELALRYPAEQELQNQLHELDRLAYGRETHVADDANLPLRNKFSQLPDLMRRLSNKTEISKVARAQTLPDL